MIEYLACTNGFSLIPTWQSGAWIRVTVPTEAEIGDLISKYPDLPNEFIDDIEDEEERPRIEQDKGWLLILLRIPYRVADHTSPYATIPMGILMKGDVFITICHSHTDMVEDFVRYSVKKSLHDQTGFNLLLSLFLSSSIWYLKYLKQINLEIKAAEQLLEESIRNEELQQLMRFEKCLVFFITSLRGNKILYSLLNKYLRHTSADYNDDLLDDVEIELHQAYSTANIYSSILSTTMEAYASILSNNLNLIMKQLTSVSIILMIPTLIASFFGMNVLNGIENASFGFAIVIFISVVLSLFGIWIFKRYKFF